MDVKFYGPVAHPHHPFCNYAHKMGPCKFCDRYYDKYPVRPDDTEDDLIARHFPHTVKRTK